MMLDHARRKRGGVSGSSLSSFQRAKQVLKEWIRRRTRAELIGTVIFGAYVVFVALGLLVIFLGIAVTLPMTNESHGRALFELLQCVAPIMEKHEFPYFMDAGTLLGAVRENQVIDGDSDVDLGFMISPKAFDNLRNAKDEIENVCNAYFMYKVDDKNSWVYWMPFDSFRVVNRADFRIFSYQFGVVSQIYLDLYVYVYDPLTDLVYAPTFVDDHNTPFTPLKDFLPLKKTCTLYDVEFFCPAEPEIVLRRTYGENWRVPSKDHATDIDDEEKGLRGAESGP
eukprot:g5240.t1